ncbi:MAG: PepSY domain-containing protein [Syntrophomonadaceae bacterium]|nr:PepSY domain-containing protein [Syntrophomonadaceae bacterium]
MCFSWRVPGLAIMILMLSVLPSCTNIREVETSKVQTVYIAENQAVSAVAKTPEVVEFARHIKGNSILQIEELPNLDDPVYTIRVAEDRGDHLIYYHTYKVDAFTGEVLRN